MGRYWFGNCFFLSVAFFPLNPWAADVRVPSLIILESTLAPVGRISCVVTFQFCRDGALWELKSQQLSLPTAQHPCGLLCNWKRACRQDSFGDQLSSSRTSVLPPISKAAGVVFCLFWQEDGLVSMPNSTRISYATSEAASGVRSVSLQLLIFR